MTPGVHPTRYQRVRQRWADRAAQRMFDRLRADPASFRSAPSTVAATFVAVLILAATGVLLAVLVWGTWHASGMGWVLVVLGWLVVLALRPRPHWLPRSAVVLEEAAYPGLHALVREMSRAVGVRAPGILAVDVDLNAYVTSIGIRGRSAMVLGLPILSLLGWPARLGVIGHELGHLRGRDTARGRIEAAAASVVGGMHYLLSPGEEELYTSWDPEPELETAGGFAAVVARGVQAVLAAPFLLLAVLLDRLSMSSRQHREYLADRRAAEVVGSDALVEFLVLDLDGLWTTTTAAARRGENPFDHLLARPTPSPSYRASRLALLSREKHRADATHPPDDLRIRLLESEPRPPSPSMPTSATCTRAEQELVGLRAAATKEFSQALRFGAYE
jgi:Zn-dependent protease with chaperone function